MSQPESLNKPSIEQEILSMLNKDFQASELLDKLNCYQEEILKRDLKTLNDTLLPALRVTNKNLEESSYNSNKKFFTQEYLNLSQKVYVHSGLIQKDQEKKQIDKDGLSPFLPNNINIKDIHANSKQLLNKKSSITVTQNTPNFSHILSSTIKSTFLGEQKATYPTIVYEGQVPHPIRHFLEDQIDKEMDNDNMLSQSKNSNFMRSTRNIQGGLQTLGGIKDNLSKMGLQSLSLKKKRTHNLSSSKFSHLGNQITSKPSNTRKLNVQQQHPVIQPIRNPFIRYPSNRK